MTSKEFNKALNHVPRKKYNECLELSEEYKNWRNGYIEMIKNCPNGNKEEGMIETVYCQRCDSNKFEIVYLQEFKTGARCLNCGNWLSIHTG